jgi:hypothetical protein
LLSRAERASDHRGKEYFAERVCALRDSWTVSQSGSTRLGYRKRSGKEPLNGLLVEAGSGSWTQLTVPMSMRETENEVNLLVPGKGLFDPALGQPPWSFALPGQGPPDEDEAPDADELGDRDG